jgi:putative spermidine/putrescine transport system substrate-binding protein
MLKYAGVIGLTILYASWGGPVFSHTDLRMVNWGGDLARAHMQALVIPWEAKTGKNVEMEYYNGGLVEMRDQVNTTNVRWDVVDMEYSDLIKACEDGLLEKIDHSRLPNVEQDFMQGSLHDCGVGTYVWATVYAYDKKAFGAAIPSTVGDFFDIKKFPGKRGLRKDPRGTLEWALMAAGVAPEKVYDTLATPQGVDLALKELETIRQHIVWWSTGPEPVQMLTDGTVTMSAAWNGRLYRPIVEDKEPIGIVWDGQLWEIEFLAIVKGSRRLENALEFVAFATDTQALADVTQYIPYGPVRKSSQSRISDLAKPHLPTENMGNALRFDSPWWAENMGWIREKFDRWMKPSIGDVQQRGARF